MKHIVLSLALTLSACEQAASLAPASERSTEEITRLGQQTWALFECSAYAEFAKDGNEAERLQALAFARGREFLEAAEASPKNSPEAFQKIPMVLAMRAAGPSHDFILGRFYEASIDYVGEKVWERKPDGGLSENPPGEESRIMNAERGLREGHCKALG